MEILNISGGSSNKVSGWKPIIKLRELKCPNQTSMTKISAQTEVLFPTDFDPTKEDAGSLYIIVGEHNSSLSNYGAPVIFSSGKTSGLIYEVPMYSLLYSGLEYYFMDGKFKVSPFISENAPIWNTYKVGVKVYNTTGVEQVVSVLILQSV